MPGPLPEANRRRRNAPTIPTTELPARGRKGRPPNPPSWVELGRAGADWWKWAWRTPQAVAWSPGDLVALARRASLEDDLAALPEPQNLDVAELLGTDPSDRSDLIEFTIRKLHALAGNKLAIAKECRELDDRFGLTPKALASLRWKIVDEQPKEQEPEVDESEVTHLDERRQRLVDAS